MPYGKEPEEQKLDHVAQDQVMRIVGLVGATEVEFEIAVAGREHHFAAGKHTAAGEQP